MSGFIILTTAGLAHALYFVGSPRGSGREIGSGIFLMGPDPSAIEATVSYVRGVRKWWDWELGVGYILHREGDGLVMIGGRWGILSNGPVSLGLRLGANLAATDIAYILGPIFRFDVNPHGGGGSSTALSWFVFQPTLGYQISERVNVYASVFDETTLNRGPRLGMRDSFRNLWDLYVESQLLYDENQMLPVSGGRFIPNLGLAL